MTIDDMINNELKDTDDNNPVIVNTKKILKIFGYKVLKEINRLNFPAFTILDDNDLSKRGFVNMMLNMLVSEEDKDKLCFHEYKAWNDVECPPASHDQLFIVERENGKLDFAKYDKCEKWINQENLELTDVIKWRSFLPYYE